MAAIADDKDVYNLKLKNLCNNDIYYFNDVFNKATHYVYGICNKETGECNKVLAKVYNIDIPKWIPEGIAHVWNKTKKEVETESKYLKIASDLGVTPNYIGTYYCNYNDNDYGIILFEHYGDGSLTDLYDNGEYEKHKYSINSQIKVILDLLYDNKLDHNDLHTDNFLYKKIGYNYLIKIIDFDGAKTFNVTKTKKRDYDIFISSTADKLNWWRSIGPDNYIYCSDESEKTSKSKTSKSKTSKSKTSKSKTSKSKTSKSKTSKSKTSKSKTSKSKTSKSKTSKSKTSK